MPRASGTSVENNFINGYITQATALTFPENACTYALNVHFDETGKVYRRKGLDYEANYSIKTATVDNYAVTEFEWYNADSNPDYNFVVQQIGDKIYFYEITTDSSLSAERHATVLDLDDYLASGAPSPVTEPCQYTSAKGYLFVVHKYCEPFYVSYNGSTFTATTLNIQIRDFEGVEDGLTITQRTTTLSDAQEYNLYNAGWGEVVMYDGGGGSTAVALSRFKEETGVYPNKCERWWYFREATSNDYDPEMYTHSPQGSSRVVGGFFILSAFNTNRSSAASAIGTVDETTSSYFRPKTICTFAGRIFYSGVDYVKYNNKVYFTQIIERDEQIEYCYQKNDPTCESYSDLLPSDGGEISILEAGSIHKIFSTQKAVIVFADNGIWTISGSELNPFKADDYNVSKISSIAIESGLSVVDVQGTPMFINNEGVYAVLFDNGRFEVQSASDQKIKKYIADIPTTSKYYIKGAYNTLSKNVQWLIRSTAPTTVDEKYTYDRILQFNTLTTSFSPWTITSTTKYLKGIVSTEGEMSDGTYKEAFRYFVTKVSSGTTHNTVWYTEESATYKDWETDGEDYDYTSEIRSGYKLDGEGNKLAQTNSVVVYTENEANSSAYFQAIWDFSNNTLSKKWSTAQQIYSSSPSYRDWRFKKLRIRGYGNAVQFRIYSESGKPFTLAGWSRFVTGNTIP